MDIKVIASSSLGNCYLVSDGTTSLLIECGIPIAKIREALNYKLSAVAGCLISHMHRDHCKSVAAIMRTGTDCYMSQPTIDSLEVSGHRAITIEARKRFQVGTFHIMPFETVHDCEGSLGFLIASGGEKLLFVTDTAYIPHKFKGVTHMMIECNYNNDALAANIQAGAISKTQYDRLLFSHFGLENLIDFIQGNDNSKLQEIHLLHLSSGNSNAEFMKSKIRAIAGVPVYVAMEK